MIMCILFTYFGLLFLIILIYLLSTGTVHWQCACFNLSPLDKNTMLFYCALHGQVKGYNLKINCAIFLNNNLKFKLNWETTEHTPPN